MGRDRKKLKYQRQKRTAVDAIRLREMNSEAHRRANQPERENFIRIIANVYGDEGEFIRKQKVEGVIRDDLTQESSNIVRRMIGLAEISPLSGREEIMAKLNKVRDFAELIFHSGIKALFLLRDDDCYYFLYRERGKFYKKSIMYPNRTTAMNYYKSERITWMSFVNEAVT